MAAQNVLVPLSEYNDILKDSETLTNVKKLLETEFPDDTCQLIAVKSLLGIETVEADPDTSDPGSDPGAGDPSTP